MNTIIKISALVLTLCFVLFFVLIILNIWDRIEPVLFDKILYTDAIVFVFFGLVFYVCNEVEKDSQLKSQQP